MGANGGNVASKGEIQEYLDLIDAVGWKWERTASSGRYRIYPPNGDPIISPASGNGRALANFKSDLERAGFNREVAEVKKAERALLALQADRRKNEQRLREAEERAKKLVAPPASRLVVPFQTPPSPSGIKPVVTETQVMAAYPHEVVYVNVKWATEALDRKQCRQRALYNAQVKKWRQAMLSGEWALNPVDSLVFDEHGCLINGQHRMWAIFECSDQELAMLQRLYPNGIPFYVTYNFPSKLAHIFDTGKMRTAPDALSVEGLHGWGMMQSAALRLAMAYDFSFEEDGVQEWPRWRTLTWTNSELVAGASEKYAGLLNFGSLASSLNHHAKVARSSGLTAGYLIDRDNPAGSPGKPNEEFWAGICGRTDLRKGDPRMAFLKFATTTPTKKGRRRQDVGVIHLAHLLNCYADWQLDKDVHRSMVNEALPMPPVWTPGMRWIGNELRKPLVGRTPKVGS